jgi:hypothetical protein
VPDILNRVRPLTLEMICKLAEGLKLPGEVLIRPYPLRQAAEELAADGFRSREARELRSPLVPRLSPLLNAAAIVFGAHA